MQMVQAYAAIANGGVLRPPRLIENVGGHPVASQEGHRVITPGTAAQLRQMLEGVLQNGGTAASINVPGYMAAGKTGTAQKVR